MDLTKLLEEYRGERYNKYLVEMAAGHTHNVWEELRRFVRWVEAKQAPPALGISVSESVGIEDRVG